MHDAKRIQSLIAQEVDSLIAFRRELHQHPEIGYQEHETAKRIQRELAAIGVQHVGGLAGGTGTIAHIPGGKPGAKAMEREAAKIKKEDARAAALAAPAPAVEAAAE